MNSFIFNHTILRDIIRMSRVEFFNTIIGRSLLYLFLLISIFVSNTSIAGQDYFSQDKTFVIGANKDFAPFEFINAKGEADGFTIDLMKSVAKANGLNITFMLQSWSDTRRDLQDKKIDAVTGMMYSRERAEKFDFSVPNLIIPYALFTRHNSQAKSLDDVRGKEIIVVKDVYAHDWLIKNKITNVLIVVNNSTEALRLLASGKHDCTIIPRLNGIDLLDDLKINDIRSIGPPVLEHKLSFAVSKGNSALLSKLNEGIFAVHQSGEYDEIYLKWFSVNKQNKQIRKVTKYVVLFLAFLSVLLLTVLLWNWLLKRTVRRKTKEIRRNETKLKQIVEGIPTPTYVVNLNREVTHWNKGCEFLTGATAKKIVGTKDYSKALYENKSYSIIDLLLDNVLSKRVQQHDNTTYRKSSVLKDSYETEKYFSNLGIDGKWLFGAATLLKDETGKVNGAIETWQDLTESKQLEKQLIQSQKMEALGTLAGGIAHDFNNILLIINAQAAMALYNLPEDSSLKNRLEQIHSAGMRAEALVKQILLFSRQAEIEPEPIQLSEIVTETLTLLKPSLPWEIKVQQDIQSDALTMADATHIHQIVMNLCTNASHAMSDAGGVLGVGLSEVRLDKDQINLPVDLQPGKFIKLTVSDTGHGIPLEIQNKILDPFFTTKKRGEGTGMGLSVTHGIIKQYGGMIDFDSDPGKGTIFRVYLPIVV